MWMESDFAWILREFFTWFYVNLNTHRFVLILMRMSWCIGRLFFSQTILGLGDPEILHFILSLPPENAKNDVNSEWFRVILGWIYVNLNTYLEIQKVDWPSLTLWDCWLKKKKKRNPVIFDREHQYRAVLVMCKQLSLRIVLLLKFIIMIYRYHDKWSFRTLGETL